MPAVGGRGMREENGGRVDGERGGRGPLAGEEQLRRGRDGGGSAGHYMDAMKAAGGDASCICVSCMLVGSSFGLQVK